MMTDNEIARELNALLTGLGVSSCHCSTGTELLNEAIVAGTVADIDATDEFVFGVRLRHNGGAPFDVFAEKDARHALRNTVDVGDFLKLRCFLKSAAFNSGFCYLPHRHSPSR